MVHMLPLALVLAKLYCSLLLNTMDSLFVQKMDYLLRKGRVPIRAQICHIIHSRLVLIVPQAVYIHFLCQNLHTSGHTVKMVNSYPK